MGKIKQPTAEELELVEQGWDEVGRSIAATVLEGGKTTKWAWDLLGPLGLYRRWMLDAWLERYKLEHPELEDPSRRPTKARPKPHRTKFTKAEQIREALKSLSEQTGR